MVKKKSYTGLKKILGVALPENQWRRLTLNKFLFVIVTSRLFSACINILIVLNTLILALDRYPNRSPNRPP